MATTRFDDWEGEYLAHFRTKGSKNGVRRYQQEDGTWTPLGLRERKAREGWGDGDERSSSRAEKKAAKAEAKAEKKAARTAAVTEAKEERRKNNIKTMTDEELKAKIERAKMEQEYKELTKSPILKAGEKVVQVYLDYKTKKEQQEIEKNRQKIELGRIEAQKVQATEATKKAKYDAKAADAEANKMASDVKGGLKVKRKAELTNAKTAFRGTTLLGALGKRANNRAKYIQENRMNEIEAKKAGRARALQILQIDKAKETTEQERYKAEQEKWKASNRKSK